MTYVLGFLFNIVLAFTMGDADALLKNDLGQPVAQLFYNVLGKSGGLTFTVFAFIILNFTGITALQANARTIWALSRDEMLPGSKYWYKIATLTGTPLIAVWLNVIFCITINLIGLGSYYAIAAIFNVTAIALDWSYCIPIICKLLYTKRLNAEGGGYRPGPWNLGKFSTAINAWAVIWTFFVTIIFIFPTVLPVTGKSLIDRKLISSRYHELRPRAIGGDQSLRMGLLARRGSQVLLRTTNIRRKRTTRDGRVAQSVREKVQSIVRDIVNLFFAMRTDTMERVIVIDRTCLCGFSLLYLTLLPYHYV